MPMQQVGVHKKKTTRELRHAMVCTTQSTSMSSNLNMRNTSNDHYLKKDVRRLDGSYNSRVECVIVHPIFPITYPYAQFAPPDRPT